jgi:hypothetical protein
MERSEIRDSASVQSRITLRSIRATGIHAARQPGMVHRVKPGGDAEKVTAPRRSNPGPLLMRQKTGLLRCARNDGSEVMLRCT